MPTTLRSFGRQNRNGTQQTLYVELPDRFDFLHLVGDVADAVLSNTLNEITFVVLHSPTGTDADSRELQREQWRGGVYIPKGQAQEVPIPIDVQFGPIPETGFVALRATFNRTMSAGARLDGLP